MGPNKETKETAHRRITPTSSHKRWKESIRQACLARVRQRQLQQHEETASEMIENELRRHSWRVQDDIMEGVVARSNDRQEAALRASHFLSEAELFELLEEVENEMQLNNEQHLEEILHQAQNEMQYWEHQVTDYEQWQSDQQKIESTAVLCPICQDANLTQHSDGSILCPNAMDGSCSARLTFDSSLPELQHMIRSTYEEHSLHCHNHLVFRVADDSRLVATCSSCNALAYVT
jgi:Replication protein A interacting C-terminal